MIARIRSVLFNERGDAFKTMMTTLNMLLLAFFIVLNSIAVIDEERKRKALGSLLGTLGILSRGMSPTEVPGAKMMLPPSSEMSQTETDILKLLASLERFSMQHDVGSKISLQKWKTGIKVFMTNDILYFRGSDTLTPFALKLMELVAELLQEVEGEINIIGHTSPDSYQRGHFPDDWTLSFARAGAAARRLIRQGGIDPERIAVSGYAGIKPYVIGSIQIPAMFNDRLEIVVNKEVPY